METSDTNFRFMVFASKYKLYLPTEEELLKELKKEYQAMESAQSDMESERRK